MAGATSRRIETVSEPRTPRAGSRGCGELLFEWSAKRRMSGSFNPVVLSDLVVDGTLNSLFATEVSLRCLNRNVTEQRLNLLQFPARVVAKSCTGTAEVVRR